MQLLKQAREMGLEVVWISSGACLEKIRHNTRRWLGWSPLLSHLQPPNTVGDPAQSVVPILEPCKAAHGERLLAPPMDVSQISDKISHRSHLLASPTTPQASRPTPRLYANPAEWRILPKSHLLLGRRDSVLNNGPESTPATVTIYTDLHRSVYLACDEVITSARLAKTVGEGGQKR